MTDDRPRRAVRVLDMHARYGCRERGACCTSGWPIPIEPGPLVRVREAMARGVIAPARTGASSVDLLSEGPADLPWLVGRDNHGCLFYRLDGRDRCQIHRALGHGALPLACRQFPRVSVIDPRGVSVTLSHYCPTAADLIGQKCSLSILTDPPAFPADAEYVGLDVREALPPALRPDMLLSWDAWWLWETEAVAAIAGAPGPSAATAMLWTAVEEVRSWAPGAVSIEARGGGPVAGAPPAGAPSIMSQPRWWRPSLPTCGPRRRARSRRAGRCRRRRPA
jgi:Fe-S-cluster containining protein